MFMGAEERLTDWLANILAAGCSTKQTHSSFLPEEEKICTISKKQVYYTVYSCPSILSL